MATNDNSNQNETTREISFEEINKKLNEKLRERILRMGKKSSFGWFESVHGTIQAINTADDLFLNNLVEAVLNSQKPSQPSAKEALAVYKTLSAKEWQQYFGLLDTKNLSQDQTEQLRTYIRESAEKEPYLRRLVRETIQHGKPITISSTPEDWEALKKKNCLGDADWSTRHIRLLPEEIDNSSVFHEVLHIGQGDDNVQKENNDSYSRELIQKQRKFIEAEARSIDYLCHDKGSPDFFNQLLIKNENELRKNQKNIPAGLTDEEKELFIHTQAVNRTIGASIHILMQPEGEKTKKAAAAYGIELTDKDLRFVNWWKEFYNNSYKEWICENYDSQKNPNAYTDNDDREQFVHNYITNRYPGLKGKDFFVTGLTDEEQKSWDIRYKGENYGQLTDEQIKAQNSFGRYGYNTDYKDGNICAYYGYSLKTESEIRGRLEYDFLYRGLPLTEEEMNYFVKIREARDNGIKTDIPMPASLKNLIETQEKILQYNSKDKEIAAFNELAASREELLKKENPQSHRTAVINYIRVTAPWKYKSLVKNDKEFAAFENKNQQPNLAAAIKQNAQEHKENDNISSNIRQESGKER